MISRLRGKLVHILDQRALVENGGVCYEVLLPSALAERLKDDRRIDQEITFETIYYIEAGDRKSSHFPRLVGFTDPVDREFFSLFTQVPGLGVKKALKSLVIPIREIAVAIETRDAARLNCLPGVGARLAEKIIAELNGKAAKFALSKVVEPLAVSEVTRTPLTKEALMILSQLQYTQQEARKMIEAALEANPKVTKVEDLITVIFRNEQQQKAEV